MIQELGLGSGCVKPLVYEKFQRPIGGNENHGKVYG